MRGSPHGKCHIMTGLSVPLLFVFILLLAYSSSEAAAASRVRNSLLLPSFLQRQEDRRRDASSVFNRSEAAKEEDFDGSLLESTSSSLAEEKHNENSLPNGPSAGESASSTLARGAPLSPHQALLPESPPQPDNSRTSSPVDASGSASSLRAERVFSPSETIAEEGVVEPLRGPPERPLTCDDQPCGEGQMTCKAISRGRFTCTCKSGYVLYRDAYIHPMCIKADGAGSADQNANELFNEKEPTPENKWAVGWAVFGLLVGGALVAAFIWAAVVFYKRSKSTESRHVREEFTSLLTDKKSSIHSILANPDLRAQEVEESGGEGEQRDTPTESPRE